MRVISEKWSFLARKSIATSFLVDNTSGLLHKLQCAPDPHYCPRSPISTLPTLCVSLLCIYKKNKKNKKKKNQELRELQGANNSLIIWSVITYHKKKKKKHLEDLLPLQSLWLRGGLASRSSSPFWPMQ